MKSIPISVVLLISAVRSISAQTVVNAGDDLQGIVYAAAAGSTISLNPGTYTLSGTLVVPKSLTLRNNQATRPTIQFSSTPVVAVQLSANNITFEGINILGGNWGIYAGFPGGGASSNIVVRNVSIDTTTGQPGSAHGLFFREVANAVADRVVIQDAQINGILVDQNSPNATIAACTVVKTIDQDAAIKIDSSPSAYVVGNTVQSPGTSAHGIYLNASPNGVVTGNNVVYAPSNGIFIDNSSNNTTVTANTIQGTGAQHAIAVKNSNNATVSGNTITGSGFHGVVLVGVQNSRVTRNTISGIRHDGITVAKETAANRTSVGNYVGSNTVVSTTRLNGVVDGTGIWLTQESNGTLVYANSSTGAPENGLAIFNSSYNHLFGNITWDNSGGGIFIFGPTDQFIGPAPAYTVVQGNYAFNLPANAGVNVRQASTTTVFDNFFRNSPTGVQLQATSGNRIFENIGANLQAAGLYSFADTTTSSYFLNRNLTSVLNYAFSSGIALDGGATLRGNYWAGHASTAPYSNFVYNQQGATGAYKDNYPFADDTLGKQPYVEVLYPTAGTFASIGALKTIEWRSGGCTYVDISYQSSATGLVSIASSHPDVGVFRWAVPNIPPSADYKIHVDCKNGANQSRNASGSSELFSVAKTGIELLTPQGNERFTAGAQVSVAWKKTPAVSAVNVLYRSGTGAFTTVLASNVTEDVVTVAAPAGATSRGSFLVRATNDTGIADSSDGFVNIRSGATPVVTGPSGTLQIGTLRQVEWTSLPNSQYVDVQYLNTTNGNYVTLIQNLPDFGRYTFLVPEQTMNGSKIRVLMKSAPASAIATVDSGETFNSSPTGSGGGTPPTPPPVTGLPQVAGLSPLVGAATSGLFTGTFSHPSGVSGHYLGYILFLPTPNVVNYVATGSCLVEYNRISNGMRLIDNAGTGWLGPLTGVPVGAGGSTLANNYCTLDTTQSTARFNGNQMSVDARVSFKAPLNGVLGTFLQELDVNGVWTGMTQFGNWFAYGVPSPKPGPFIIGGSPISGAGSSATYNVSSGHTSGFGALSMVNLLISSQIVGGSPCHVVFFPGSNSVHLVNSDGSGVVPGSITPGTNTGTLSNGRCTVSGAGMTLSSSGQNLTISLPLAFNPATFGGAKSVYANTFDNGGLLTHWQQFGTWTVQ